MIVKRIWLPYPPSANAIRTVTRSKPHRIVSTQAARDYKATVSAHCLSEGWRRQGALTGDLLVTVEHYPRDKRRDIPNGGKILFDALSGWAWVDDKQIKSLVEQHVRTERTPYVVVTARRIEDFIGEWTVKMAARSAPRIRGIQACPKCGAHFDELTCAACQFCPA